MKHFVLIDNHSGYVWGEATAETPFEACKIVDEDFGAYNREYEHANLNATLGGYWVHEAPEGWVPVDDGQDQNEINRAAALPLVAQVAFRNTE